MIYLIFNGIPLCNNSQITPTLVRSVTPIVYNTRSPPSFDNLNTLFHFLFRLHQAARITVRTPSHSHTSPLHIVARNVLSVPSLSSLFLTHQQYEPSVRHVQFDAVSHRLVRSVSRSICGYLRLSLVSSTCETGTLDIGVGGNGAMWTSVA